MESPQTLVFLGWEGPSAFSTFSPNRWFRTSDRRAFLWPALGDWDGKRMGSQKVQGASQKPLQPFFAIFLFWGLTFPTKPIFFLFRPKSSFWQVGRVAILESRSFLTPLWLPISQRTGERHGSSRSRDAFSQTSLTSTSSLYFTADFGPAPPT